nr:hypothetical protein [Vibrio diabolicus]
MILVVKVVCGGFLKVAMFTLI